MKIPSLLVDHDGEKIAWFSDKSGEYELMIIDKKGIDEVLKDIRSRGEKV